MRLLLIRHAASDHRPGADNGLTKAGVRQARDLTMRLRSSSQLTDCASLRCSPLPRALQTANILLGQLPGLELEEDAAFCEMNDFIECRDESPPAEKFSEVLARVGTTLERLARTYPEDTVVAVTHAGFIVASVIALFGIPRPGTGARLDPDHASLTEWHYQEEGWRLVRYNVR